MKLTEIDFNLAKKIAGAGLLTATDTKGCLNTMTVSWGGSGILWGKEVAFVFVRPERHTFGFCEDGKTMSLSFFGKEKKDVLSFCGTKSGRDVDKFEACDLKYTCENGFCVFDDAKITVLLKKLYAQSLTKECFVTDECQSFYRDGGYHRMYVCEIVDILQG